MNDMIMDPYSKAYFDKQNCKNFYRDLKLCLDLRRNNQHSTKFISGPLMKISGLPYSFDFTKCDDEYVGFLINNKYSFVSNIRFNFQEIQNSYMSKYEIKNQYDIFSNTHVLSIKFV